jgi:hypothetical protein
MLKLGIATIRTFGPVERCFDIQSMESDIAAIESDLKMRKENPSGHKQLQESKLQASGKCK